jgi:hypothetical protein
MGRKTKAPPKQRLVYEGPVGLCPCCNKPTEVRLGGTLGEPDVPGWVVPTDVLELLYREVAARIREKDGALYVTDPSEYDATRRAKLFFVDGDDGIAGPFGQLGLKVFLGANFGAEHTGNVRVYVVTTTHRALDLIRKSPYARPPDEGGNLDGSADLF